MIDLPSSDQGGYSFCLQASVGDCLTIHVGIFQNLKKLVFALFAKLLFKGWGVIKVILCRETLQKINSFMPAARASSMPYWISGRSTNVMISFDTDLVAGKNRVPKPARGKWLRYLFSHLSNLTQYLGTGLLSEYVTSKANIWTKIHFPYSRETKTAMPM